MDSRAVICGHVMPVVDAVYMLPIIRLMTHGWVIRSAWSKGWHHAVLHSSHELVTRLQWLCLNDNTVYIVIGIISRPISTAAICCVFQWRMLHVRRWIGCWRDARLTNRLSWRRQSLQNWLSQRHQSANRLTRRRQSPQTGWFSWPICHTSAPVWTSPACSICLVWSP